MNAPPPTRRRVKPLFVVFLVLALAFVGCAGYPECRVTYPLPQKGTILPTHTVCDRCGSPEIKVIGGKRPWITCINMDCPKKEETTREGRTTAKAS